MEYIREFIVRTVVGAVFVVVPAYLAFLLLLQGMKSAEALVRPVAALMPGASSSVTTNAPLAADAHPPWARASTMMVGGPHTGRRGHNVVVTGSRDNARRVDATAPGRIRRKHASREVETTEAVAENHAASPHQ